MTALLFNFMLIQSAVSHTPLRTLIPDIEIWLTIIGMIVAFGVALVGIYLKINIEIAVLKAQYKALYSMDKAHSENEKTILDKLSDVQAGISEIKGEMKSKQDK